MTKVRNLHQKWMKDADYRKEYAAQETEFMKKSQKIPTREIRLALDRTKEVSE